MGKKCLKAALVVALSMILSGCGKSASSQQAETPGAEEKSATQQDTVQSDEEKQIRYHSEYKEIEWDAGQFRCGFVTADSIGLIGWRSVTGEDENTAWEYIMNIVDAQAGDSADARQHSIVLQVPENWSIQSAVSDGELIYFCANEVATKEKPGAFELYLAACGEDGSLVFQMPLSGELGTKDAKISSLTLDMEGNIWFLERLSKNICCFTPGEEEIRKIEGNGKQIEGFVSDKSKNLYLYGKTRDGDENLNLWKLDAEDGPDIEPLVIEDPQIRDIKPGMETDFLFLKEEELVWYDIAAQEEKTICTLTDMGLQFTDIYDFAEVGDGVVAMLLAAAGTADASIAWIIPTETAVSGSTQQESGTIIVACLEADDMLRDMVAAFNRSGSSNIAVINEYYDQYQPDATKEDALKRLNADLSDGTAGDVLDLVGLTGYATRRQYVELGLLEELYAWIDNDPEIQREDYLQSLWKANEINGGLYNLVSLYDVNTKIGAASQFGEEYCLDLEWMLSQENPAEVFGSHYTREEFFHDLCVFWLSDRQNLEDSILFDTETMGRVLAFAKGLPQIRDETLGIDNSNGLYFGEMLLQTTGWEYGDGVRRDLGSVRNAAAALGEESGLDEISSLLEEMEYPYTEEDAAVLGSFAAQVSLVGFPVREGAGSSFVNRVSLGICSTSQNKEGAWELLKYTLSDEAQLSRGEFETFSVPAKKSIWQQVCENNIAPENISVSWIGSALSGSEYDVLVPPLSQVMVDSFDDLTKQMLYLDEIDPQLFTILTEEADVYFQGQCSDTEAAGAIQNRVRLYLSETGS